MNSYVVIIVTVGVCGILCLSYIEYPKAGGTLSGFTAPGKPLQTAHAFPSAVTLCAGHQLLLTHWGPATHSLVLGPIVKKHVV